MPKERVVTAPNYEEFRLLSKSQLGEALETTGKRLTRLKRKRGRIKNSYDVVYARGELQSLVDLFGPGALKLLSKPREERDYFSSLNRESYFKDIKLRSKIRKINDRIEASTLRYNYILGLIKIG